MKEIIRDYIKKIQDTFFEVIHDFKSCIIHANDLLIYSPAKNIKIFFAGVILILILITFRSDSKTAFYINLLMIVFLSLVSYFIFCLSDYFWLLIEKNMLYRSHIKNKKNIGILLKRAKDEKSLQEEINFEEKIISTAKYNTEGYKIHAKRYAIEVSSILLILLFTDPLFFVLNIFLFGGMFFYVFLYERQFIDQAFDDIGLLLYCINRLHKENPEKCKRFIMKNKHQEIKDLKKLYEAVTKSSEKEREI